MVKFLPPDKNDSLTRITLDGTAWYFHFSFNYLEGFWTVGFYDGNKNPLIAGMKLVPNYPVNHFVRQFIDFPGGWLIVRTKLERIGRDDFTNGNAEIYYASKAEVDEYLAEEEA